MPSFHIQNFGCRATQADAAAIERQLLESGYVRAATAASAEFVVINTCTVTAAADAQARQAIAALRRRQPAARLLVTGCYAQRAPEELAALPGVDWVVGNSHQTEISALLDQKLRRAAPHDGSGGGGFVPLEQFAAEPPSLACGPAKILTGDILAATAILVGALAPGDSGHTRPVLKVQDGCDQRCAYCVIPFVRGQSRSLPLEQALDHARRMVAAGAREVVLSGINLGAYGRDLEPRVELTALLDSLLAQTSLERLRLSSLEPMHVTRDLVARFAATGRLARHFHVPLQSGSDRVLAAMRRRYRAEHYARRIELVRELLPDAAIGADVIAGFPGETEADFRATLGLVERLPITYLHVFSFSPRPGTRAAEIPEGVSPRVIQQRARELRSLGAEKASAFRATQAGTLQRVLTLARSEDASTAALSSNYLTVGVPGRWPPNLWMDVRLTQTGTTILRTPLPA